MQYKWIALTVTVVGTLMAGIDDRILVVGLPTIMKEMGVTVEEAIWISQAYTLASTICLLLIGRTADIRGRIKIYNVGFLIFTLGSALAAASFFVSAADRGKTSAGCRSRDARRKQHRHCDGRDPLE